MLDPFEKKYEECSKCGGKMSTLHENSANVQKTFSVCRKCNHRVLLTQVNTIRENPNSKTYSQRPSRNT